MVLKLSPQNAEAIFNLFTTAVITRQSATLDEQLVMLHMIAIYKKLRAKYEGLPRKAYNISVTVPEAIAYRIYWRDGFPYGALEADRVMLAYEYSVIIDHCTHIDKELANFRIYTLQQTKFLNQ